MGRLGVSCTNSNYFAGKELCSVFICDQTELVTMFLSQLKYTVFESNSITDSILQSMDAPQKRGSPRTS